LELDEPKLAIYQYDRIDDFHPESLFNKALAYYHLQRYDEAIAILKDLVENTDKVQNAYYFLIEMLLVKGYIDEGFLYINEARAHYGDTFNLNYMRGFAYSKENKWLAAYSEYLRALPGYESNPKIHHVLGIAAENIGQKERAIEHFKDGIYLNSSDEVIILDLIKMYVKYNYVTNLEDLKALMSDMDDEVVEKALKCYKTLGTRL
jgi:tetratricopeptide (TPR) repeat protein